MFRSCMGSSCVRLPAEQVCSLREELANDTKESLRHISRLIITDLAISITPDDSLEESRKGLLAKWDVRCASQGESAVVVEYAST